MTFTDAAAFKGSVKMEKTWSVGNPQFIQMDAGIP